MSAKYQNIASKIIILEDFQEFLTHCRPDNMLRAACRGRLTSLRFRQTAFSRPFVACLGKPRVERSVLATAFWRKGPMAEHDGGEEEERLLRARLETLSGALRKRRNEPLSRPDAEGGGESSSKFGSAMGLGLRASSEFVAAIVVGGLIGWLLDFWLGTKPAFLVVFFMLGVGGGMWNVIRVTSPKPRGGLAQRVRESAPQVGRTASPEANEDED
jgi:ATP synthase protein I